MEQFGDKVAVITGGASGIGLATARRLTREGMKLVLADIQPEPLARAESEIRALGVEALGVQTDVGDLAQVEALAERTFAPPCPALHNAPTSCSRPTSRTPPASTPTSRSTSPT